MSASPYRTAAQRPKRKRGSREAPLALPIGVPFPWVCVKCGTHRRLRLRSASFRYTDSLQWAVAIITAFGGVTFRQWHAVTLPVPLCADCDERWERADQIQRRAIAAAVAIFFAVLLLVIGTRSMVGLLSGVAVLVLAFPPLFLLRRAVLRQHSIWLSGVSTTEIVLGGVCRKARRAALASPPKDGDAG